MDIDVDVGRARIGMKLIEIVGSISLVVMMGCCNGNDEPKWANLTIDKDHRMIEVTCIDPHLVARSYNSKDGNNSMIVSCEEQP